MKQCIKITIGGKVQGVGYRAFVQKEAQKLGVEGTVQNEEDGTIQILASGNSEKLDSLIDALYKGTSKSKVASVSAEPLNSKKDFRGAFRIIGFEEK